MRLTLALFISFAVSPALAHIGHIGEVAGHGHWIALGGIAIAVGIAALGARKKSDDTQAEEDASEDDIEEESAPA
ncbi:hypothetical protein L0666_12280 [Octadecabacter sp. CECT 8868]|uniref:DUF6732 family protein n=1 Tax=Octadecabacter algicola TaxID=2909342 RepID=UPI001F16DCE2|nr:DUF6732 family protein [Octadecabacter algicola]MCF2905766.1 hypothetical protein [Octadecabacter algicola]